MGQLINLLLVLGSLGGIAFILWRKIPLLLEFPAEEIKMGDFVKQGMRNIAKSREGKSEQVIEAVLSKARNLARLAGKQASHTETQTTVWLQGFKEKSEKQKQEFSKSYWQQIRKKPGKK